MAGRATPAEAPFAPVPRLRRLALALLAGGVFALAGANFKGAPAVGKRASCAGGLRRIRAAGERFETTLRMLPGHTRAPDGRVVRVEKDAGAIVARQLAGHVLATGEPGAGGLLGPFLTTDIPLNPYTQSRAIAVLPREGDALEEALASNAGWAYLPEGGSCPRGPLPPGVFLPCGVRERRGAFDLEEPAAALSFDLEDGIPWR